MDFKPKPFFFLPQPKVCIVSVFLTHLSIGFLFFSPFDVLGMNEVRVCDLQMQLHIVRETTLI